MDRDREVVGTTVDGGVDELGVGVRERVGVVATIDGALPHHRIAQVREVRVVELDVPATGDVEGVDLGAIDRRQVGEEHLEVGVGVDVDPRPTAAEVHHRRRGDGDLRRLGGDRREVLVVGDLDVVRAPQRADHGQLRRCQVDGRRGVGAGGDVARHGDSLELFEEVEVEPSPAELAVGHRAHADRLELGDRVGDRDILGLAELGGRDRAVGTLLAGSQQGRWTQQAPDVVGAKWRVDGAHAQHDDSRAVTWSDPGPHLANARPQDDALIIEQGPGAPAQQPPHPRP